MYCSNKSAGQEFITLMKNTPELNYAISQPPVIAVKSHSLLGREGSSQTPPNLQSQRHTCTVKIPPEKRSPLMPMKKEIDLANLVDALQLSN